MAPKAVLAPSLVKLRRELKSNFPKRDTRTDGWLGDPAHQARISQHNPDAKGVVHALDLDSDGLTKAEKTRLLKSLIGDARVWYVIHQGVIWSRTHGWKARRYTGENPHTGHIHVSIRLTASAESSPKAWLKEAVVAAKKAPAKAAAPARKAPAKKAAPAKAPAPKAEAPAKVKADHEPGSRTLQVGDRGEDVAYLQRFIGFDLDDDGIFGPATERAVKRWHKLRGRQMSGTVSARDWRDILTAT